MSNSFGITRAQIAALTTLNEFICSHGYSPSMSELAKNMGFRSANGAQDICNRLVRDGYVSAVYKKARSLRLTPKGFDVLLGSDRDDNVEAMTGLIK